MLRIQIKVRRLRLSTSKSLDTLSLSSYQYRFCAGTIFRSIRTMRLNAPRSRLRSRGGYAFPSRHLFNHLSSHSLRDTFCKPHDPIKHSAPAHSHYYSRFPWHGHKCVPDTLNRPASGLQNCSPRSENWGETGEMTIGVGVEYSMTRILRHCTVRGKP